MLYKRTNIFHYVNYLSKFVKGKLDVISLYIVNFNEILLKKPTRMHPIHEIRFWQVELFPIPFVPEPKDAGGKIECESSSFLDNIFTRWALSFSPQFPPFFARSNYRSFYVSALSLFARQVICCWSLLSWTQYTSCVC